MTEDAQHGDRSTEIVGPPQGLSAWVDEEQPSQIGPYRILEVVARSMAVVYKAVQENPRRIVALKVPKGGRLMDREERQRFLREVALGASVDHAGIVPVLDAGEVDGVPYYTMPYVEGRNLRQYLESEDCRMPETINLFTGICRIVQALHQKGLVHRDIKPENVMVDAHGNLRLLDFGLAREQSATRTLVTMDGCVTGTLAYLAPELLKSGTEPDPKQDVYALGVMGYWMLTGQKPYEVPDATAESLMRISKEDYDAPAVLNAEIPPGVNEVILGALERDPLRRLSNAAAILEGMEGAEPVGHAVETSPDADRADARSRLPLLLLCMGVGVLLLAVAVWKLPDFSGKREGVEQLNDLEGRGVLALRNRKDVSTGNWDVQRMARQAFANWDETGSPAFLRLEAGDAKGRLQVRSSAGQQQELALLPGGVVDLLLPAGTWSFELRNAEGQRWSGTAVLRASAVEQAGIQLEALAEQDRKKQERTEQ